MQPPLGGLSAAKLALLRKRVRRSGTERDSGIRRVERDGPLPLSFPQERLWFLDQLEPGTPLYNIPAVLHLEGPLRVEALERALGEIVRRHEALRTVFRAVDGRPTQGVLPAGPFVLPVEDLSGLPPGPARKTVRERAGEVAGRGFDLEWGPLFRAVLLRLGEA
ncbi:MAG TPA: condensation domain-containing protein, partial [Longimicrobiaceae bacterium]|nr:condensation domain-containing protein [Longimicrobiaceae bacterium]